MATTALLVSGYLIWSNERKKATALQDRLEPKLRLFLHSDPSRGTEGIEVGRGPNGEELPYIQVSADSLTDAIIYECVPSIRRVEYRGTQSEQFKEVWGESRPIPWIWHQSQGATISRGNPVRFNLLAYDPRMPSPFDVAPADKHSNMLNQFYSSTGRTGEYRYTIHVAGRDVVPGMAWVSVKWKPRGYPSVALEPVEIA